MLKLLMTLTATHKR